MKHSDFPWSAHISCEEKRDNTASYEWKSFCLSLILSLINRQSEPPVDNNNNRIMRLRVPSRSRVRQTLKSRFVYSSGFEIKMLIVYSTSFKKILGVNRVLILSFRSYEMQDHLLLALSKSSKNVMVMIISFLQ